MASSGVPAGRAAGTASAETPQAPWQIPMIVDYSMDCVLTEKQTDVECTMFKVAVQLWIPYMERES